MGTKLPETITDAALLDAEAERDFFIWIAELVYTPDEGIPDSVNAALAFAQQQVMQLRKARGITAHTRHFTGSSVIVRDRPITPR